MATRKKRKASDTDGAVGGLVAAGGPWLAREWRTGCALAGGWWLTDAADVAVVRASCSGRRPKQPCDAPRFEAAAARIATRPHTARAAG